jgi:glutathione S-transferase
MKLHEISWSIYPLRIVIYLAEKGIADIDRVEVPLPSAPGQRIGAGLTRAATVPALDTGDGPMIGSSVAILEYLEELYPTPNLLGETPYQRARTREFVSVIDEAAVHMGVWVHQANPFFAAFHSQDMAVALAAREMYYDKLRLLDVMTADIGGDFIAGPTITIADCITFATQMTSIEQFGIPFPSGCENLERWYARFAERPSAQRPAYPPFVLDAIKDKTAY